MLPIALLTLAAAAPADDINALCQAPPPVIFSPGAEYGPDERKYQGITSIERAPNGRLWAFWYAGPVREDRYNYLCAATSSDDGATWSDLKFVVDPDGDGPLRAADPCPWLAPDGKLWLFWFQNGGGATPALFTMTCPDPGEEDPHWSEPRFIHDGIMMCKPILTTDGESLLPTAIWHREGSCRVLVSTDQGQTFTLRGTATVPDEKDRNCDEPMMVQRRDGSLWMLVRTTYGIGETTSTDGGRTWTDVTPSDLAHPASRFFLRRLNSGNLLLVKHGPLHEKTGRQQLTAYLSKDDGHTWLGGLLLDERATVSYPDGTQAEDGTIYIIYDWNRADEKHVLLATFSEADVLAAKPSDTTRLRVLVNHATGVNPKPWLKDQKPPQLKDNQDGAPRLTEPAATLEAVGGEARAIKEGDLVFGNRPNYVWNKLPDALEGKRFVFATIDSAEAVCREPGVVYVATPAHDRNKDSVIDTLVEQGFEKAAMPEFVLFLMSGKVSAGNACTVYQKTMAAGETIKIGKWGVIVF